MPKTKSNGYNISQQIPYVETTSYHRRCDVTMKRRCFNVWCLGSILLNIHEVWPRPFWGGRRYQNKLPVDHLIGHIPFASLEADKRSDKINQNQESLNILCPKQENSVSSFRVPPLIKIICLFAAD